VQGNHYFDESEKVAFPAATLGFTGFPIIRIYRFPHHPDLPVSLSSGFTGFPIIRIYRFPHHPDLPVSLSSGFTGFPIIRIYWFPHHPDLPVSPSSRLSFFYLLLQHSAAKQATFSKSGKKGFFCGKTWSKTDLLVEQS
jgi:hypothetical protein